MIDPEHEFRDAQRPVSPHDSLAKAAAVAFVVFVALPAVVGLVIAGIAFAATSGR